MNIEKLHQLCGETLKFLGKNYQIYLAVEEMAELLKELLKDANPLEAYAKKLLKRRPMS